MPLLDATRRGVLGGGLGAAIGKIVGLPRQAMIEPLLEALGLPRTGSEFASGISGGDEEPGLLSKALGLGYEAATDPLSYLGSIGGITKMAGLGRVARELGEAGGEVGRLVQKAVPQIADVAPAKTLGDLEAMAASSASRAAKSSGLQNLRSEFESPLARATGTEAIPGLAADLAHGPSSTYAADYLAQYPDKLKDLIQAAGDPRTFSRFSPEAGDLAEASGLGARTSEGLTFPGMQNAPSLLRGRGGKMFPLEQGKISPDLYQWLAMEPSPMDKYLAMRRGAFNA